MAREEQIKAIWLKACQLCAGQEKAPSQIMAKLLRYGASEEEAVVLLERLQAEGFVDVSRFARAYVSDKLRFNSWGKIKVSFNLRHLGIDEDTITEALSAIEPDAYEAIAEKVAAAKLRRLPSGRPLLERQMKTIDFLRGKGFEFDIAKKIVGNLSIREQS